jgi:hypothetical protein
MNIVINPDERLEERMKSEAVIRVEEQICQSLKPYLSTGFGKKADSLLKSGTQIFVHIDGYVVMLKRVSPIEVDFVTVGDKVEVTARALGNPMKSSALFKALDNNIMQRIK